MPLLLFLMAVLVWGDPARMCVKTGNVQPMVTAMVLAALLMLARGPGWSRWLAGVCIGLATSIKLFPVFIAMYLVGTGLYRRRTRMRDAGLLALGIFVALQFVPGSWAFWQFVLETCQLWLGIEYLITPSEAGEK